MAYFHNHLSEGYRTIKFKDREVSTSFNSKKFETNIDDLGFKTAAIGIIPPGYEHRADKIADLFYEDPTLDWLVLWSNKIYDPFEQLNVGDRIAIVDL